MIKCPLSNKHNEINICDFYTKTPNELMEMLKRIEDKLNSKGED